MAKNRERNPDIQHAESLREAEGLDRAIEYLATAAETCAPANDLLYLTGLKSHRAHLLNDAGRFEESIAECREILLLQPDKKTALGTLHRAYGATGRFEEAEAVWGQLREIDPSRYEKPSFRLTYLWFRDALSKLDYDGAAKILIYICVYIHPVPTQIKQLMRDTNLLPETAPVQFGEKPPLSAIIKILERIRAESRRDAGCLYALGRAYEAMGKGDKSLALIQNAISIDPDLQPAQPIPDIVYVIEEGEELTFRQAQRRFRNALSKLDYEAATGIFVHICNHVRPTSNQITGLMHETRLLPKTAQAQFGKNPPFPAIIAILNRKRAESPKDAGCLCALGFAHTEDGQMFKAQRCFVRAQEIEPDNPFAASMLQQKKFKSLPPESKPTKAETRPNDRVGRAAIRFINAGQYEEAIQALVPAYDPQNLYGAGLLATAYLRSGNFAEADKILGEVSLSQNPRENGSIHHLQMESAFRQKKYRLARQYAAVAMESGWDLLTAAIALITTGGGPEPIQRFTDTVERLGVRKEGLQRVRKKAQEIIASDPGIVAETHDPSPRPRSPGGGWTAQYGYSNSYKKRF